MRRLASVVAVMVGMVFADSQTEAAKRTFVVGINGYPAMPAQQQLKRAIGDARAIAEKLTGLGN